VNISPTFLGLKSKSSKEKQHEEGNKQRVEYNISMPEG
jgi:hypothetical protein